MIILYVRTLRMSKRTLVFCWLFYGHRKCSLSLVGPVYVLIAVIVLVFTNK